MKLREKVNIKKNKNKIRREKIILNKDEYFEFISDKENSDKIDMDIFYVYLIPGYDSNPKIYHVEKGEKKSIILILIKYIY